MHRSQFHLGDELAFFVSVKKTEQRCTSANVRNLQNCKFLHRCRQNCLHQILLFSSQQFNYKYYQFFDTHFDYDVFGFCPNIPIVIFLVLHLYASLNEMKKVHLYSIFIHLEFSKNNGYFARFDNLCKNVKSMKSTKMLWLVLTWFIYRIF